METHLVTERPIQHNTEDGWVCGLHLSWSWAAVHVVEMRCSGWWGQLGVSSSSCVSTMSLRWAVMSPNTGWHQPHSALGLSERATSREQGSLGGCVCVLGGLGGLMTSDKHWCDTSVRRRGKRGHAAWFFIHKTSLAWAERGEIMFVFRPRGSENEPKKPASPQTGFSPAKDDVLLVD